MEVLSQLCFLLSAPTHPYYCEQRFLKIKAHWFVCYFRLWGEGQAGTLSKCMPLVPLRTYKCTYLHPLQTSSLCSRESSWYCITLYYHFIVVRARASLQNLKPLHSWRFSRGEGCTSLAALAPCSPTARLLFCRLGTWLWSLPSPPSPCVAAAVGWPDLCSASHGALLQGLQGGC